MQYVQQAKLMPDWPLSGTVPDTVPTSSSSDRSDVALPPAWTTFNNVLRKRVYPMEFMDSITAIRDLCSWLLKNRGTAQGEAVQNELTKVLSKAIQVRVGTAALSPVNNAAEYDRFIRAFDTNVQKEANPSFVPELRVIRNTVLGFLIANRAMITHLVSRLDDQLAQVRALPLANMIQLLFKHCRNAELSVVDLCDAVDAGVSPDAVHAALPNGGRCQLVPDRVMDTAAVVRVLSVSFSRSLPDLVEKIGEEQRPTPFALFVHEETAAFVQTVYSAINDAWAVVLDFTEQYGHSQVGSFDEMMTNEKCVGVCEALATKYLQHVLNAMQYIGPAHINDTLASVSTSASFADAVEAMR